MYSVVDNYSDMGQIAQDVSIPRLLISCICCDTVIEVCVHLIYVHLTWKEGERTEESGVSEKEWMIFRERVNLKNRKFLSVVALFCGVGGYQEFVPLLYYKWPFNLLSLLLLYHFFYLVTYIQNKSTSLLPFVGAETLLCFMWPL